MAGPPQSGSTPDTDLDAAIQARLDSLDSGNYRATTDVVLSTFAQYLQNERGITDLSEVGVLDCRRYAQWLHKRVEDEDDDLSAASAHEQGPYFTIVRAFLGWCVDDERIGQNPARPNRVKSELPEYTGDPDRQFWTQEARDALLEYVDEQVRTAMDEESTSLERERAYRDRAVVAMLGLTGARGAELFADPRDDQRDGLRWDDVDLDTGIAEVFGKTREHQPIALTDTVVDALRRYRKQLDPATDDWPVFPSQHWPSVGQSAREQLRDRGWDKSEIETAFDDATGMAVIREHELVPPALSKDGARSLMERLCADAGIEIDGEYLKPHGGRRGLGSTVYADDAELAQELLRHESIETTHEAYRKEDAIKRRERLNQVVERD